MPLRLLLTPPGICSPGLAFWVLPLWRRHHSTQLLRLLWEPYIPATTAARDLTVIATDARCIIELLHAASSRPLGFL